MKRYLILLLVLTCFACNKEENDKDIDTNYILEKDLTLAVSDLSTVLHLVDGVMDFVDSNKTDLIISDCIDDELVLTYPDSSDGQYTNFVKAAFYNKKTCDLVEVKDGALLIYYSGSRDESNFKDSIVFDYFSINQRYISGYITQEQTGSGKMVTSTISTSQTVNLSTRKFVGELHTDKTNYNTASETWEITGSGLFASKEVEITNGLIIDFSCSEKHPWRFPINGSTSIKHEKLNRTINYGNNRCDRDVLIEGTNEQSITHTLF